MEFVHRSLIVLLTFIICTYICLAASNFRIGVVNYKNQPNDVSNWDVMRDQINSFSEFEEPEVLTVPEIESNVAYKALCTTLCSIGVSVLVSPNRRSIASDIIESTCAKVLIPYIATHWDSSSKENAISTSFNLYPDSLYFSKGLATIVKSLDWENFVIILENEEGLSRLQEVLKLENFEENTVRNRIVVKQLGLGPDYRPLLKEVLSLLSPRRIVLDCHVDKILDVLRQAKEVKLLDDFSTSFFFTSLDAHTLHFDNLNVVTNFTTIRLFDPKSDLIKNAVEQYYPEITPETLRIGTALRHDAMLLLAKWLNTLREKYPDINLTSEIKYCNTSDSYVDPLEFINELRSISVSEALTGKFTLESGNREKFNLEVIEVNNPDKPIAFWSSESPDSIHLTRNATEREKEFKKRMQNYNFIVSSKLGKPYLMLIDEKAPVTNSNLRGFSKDLIMEVARHMNISFQFILAEKNSPVGIVKDLVTRRADLGICDFTITQERSEMIDFSLPFMSLGISILHKETEEEEINNIYGFMRPFSSTVWIYTITLYLLMSIVILIIARLDPDDWENPHPCDPRPEELENIWGIKNCLWLTLGSIMTQGCDILPKGVGSRIATAMWWFFSLIMTSTYTANLAAFLTMYRKDDSINSLDDLANQNKVKFGVMTGGSTQSFFEHSNNTLYQKMWATMKNENPSVFEDSNAKGVERVLSTKKGLYAFFMESAQIEYELERNCALRRIGQPLDSKSYGIGMPLGAEYRHQINDAILHLQEHGKLSEIKTKWWIYEDVEDKSCSKSEGENGVDELKLSLANVGGVFIVLAVMVGFAFLLAIMMFLWNVRNIAVTEHVSYWEALKCEVKFACNIKVTKKLAKPVISESSSSNGQDDDKSMARTVLAGAGSFLNVNATVLHRFGLTDVHE